MFSPAFTVTSRPLGFLILSLALTALGCDAVAEQTEPSAPPAPEVGLPTVALAPAFPKLTFNRPVAVTTAGDATGRLFVVEQRGHVRVFLDDRATESAKEFLDIADRVRMRHNEEGLLDLAFHPRFVENGHFYVYYTASTPRRGVLSRFSVTADDANKADPGSEHVILEVEQPYGNHNGATVTFGPDGFLYLSLGDGGYANDPHGHGQDLTTLLGTVLRLDIDRPAEGKAYAIPADNPFVGREDARPEIWAYGLRNVWRMSFDPETGDLWAGDVGQNRWEEIDRIVKGGNYGWNVREGKHPFREGDSATMIDPIVEYGRGEGISITGGRVYRGSKFPALRGVYLYADYVTGRMWGFRTEGGELRGHGVVSKRGGVGVAITSFGVDADGELLVCEFDRPDGRRGRLYRVTANP